MDLDKIILSAEKCSNDMDKHQQIKVFQGLSTIVDK